MLILARIAIKPNPAAICCRPADHASNYLHSLGKHSFNFHHLNRVGGLFWLNHLADQKVFCLPTGLTAVHLVSSIFFGVQGG